MKEGPDIARIAALVADPARSAMLLALMDGRALTATELARVGGITKQTASGHLAKLVDGDVLCVEAQGRHRYFRLAGAHVAALLEALMLFSGDVAPSLRTGPKEPALRKARICYDHLAGEMGVMLFDCAREGGWLSDDLNLSDQGWTKLAGIGVSANDLSPSNCPLCRTCLDWSQRRGRHASNASCATMPVETRMHSMNRVYRRLPFYALTGWQALGIVRRTGSDDSDCLGRKEEKYHAVPPHRRPQ